MRLFLISLLIFWSAASQAGMIDGLAVNVADGDTITILDSERKQHRVRIDGIDAPERGQSFGTRARENLSSMIHGKSVLADCKKTDRYGRQVCKVWVQPMDCSQCQRTLDAGYAQILNGYAWWYREYAKEQTVEDRELYESAEVEARQLKFGLWADPYPEAPWDWRRKTKAIND